METQPNNSSNAISTLNASQRPDWDSSIKSKVRGDLCGRQPGVGVGVGGEVLGWMEVWSKP